MQQQPSDPTRFLMDILAKSALPTAPQRPSHPAIKPKKASCVIILIMFSQLCPSPMTMTMP